MNKKLQVGFSPIILIVVVGIVAVVVGGFLYLTKPSKPSEPSERNDMGCWPPSCSLIPNAEGKQMCEDWKAGKKLEWSDCKYFSDQPNCVKLCEFEKQGVNSSQTGGQKPNFSTLPPLVKAEFSTGVSQTDKNFIVQGISAMDFYLKQWFGKSTDKPSELKVTLASGETSLASQGEVTVEKGMMVIHMETGGEIWNRQIQSNNEIGGEWRPRFLAHEYMHVYQFQNGCGKGLETGNPVVPAWFIEGEAEWLSYKAMKEAGFLPQISILQLVLPVAKQQSAPLNSFEKPENKTFPAYFLFTTAVDYLMKDKQIKTLDGFCKNIGSGMDAAQAFNTAFDISLEQFYANFESYRKTW